jgi:formiminoglutamase
VKGFDICEVAPRFDSDNTTAKLAAVLIFAVVETMAECEGLLFF